jgi:hypothetical protein
VARQGHADSSSDYQVRRWRHRGDPTSRRAPSPIRTARGLTRVSNHLRAQPLTGSPVGVLTKRPAIHESGGHRRSLTLKKTASLSSTEPTVVQELIITPWMPWIEFLAGTVIWRAIRKIETRAKNAPAFGIRHAHPTQSRNPALAPGFRLPRERLRVIPARRPDVAARVQRPSGSTTAPLRRRSIESRTSRQAQCGGLVLA